MVLSMASEAHLIEHVSSSHTSPQWVLMLRHLRVARSFMVLILSTTRERFRHLCRLTSGSSRFVERCNPKGKIPRTRQWMFRPLRPGPIPISLRSLWRVDGPLWIDSVAAKIATQRRSSTVGDNNGIGSSEGRSSGEFIVQCHLQRRRHSVFKAVVGPPLKTQQIRVVRFHAVTTGNATNIPYTIIKQQQHNPTIAQTVQRIPRRQHTPLFF